VIANGTIDLECGSTTNNLDRQKQVGFTNTYFVTANRYVAKKASNIQRARRPQGQDRRVDVGDDQPQVGHRGEREAEPRPVDPDGRRTTPRRS